MKKDPWYILLPTVCSIILAPILFSGCKDPAKEAEIKEFYRSPHQIRKMFVKDVESVTPGKSSLSGGFFLFVGNVHGESTGETRSENTFVRFGWEIKDKTYIITTLPLEKIRVKLVEDHLTPTVSFFLDHSKDGRGYPAVYETLQNYYNPHEAFSNYLEYATFTVNEKDWPSNINLPLTAGYSR